ncbi:MAG: carboxymuconolactone decarboxylase family protein [Polaromonas sp.]|uniref:carboxymuconolactone decarboxylase family protein n=1 Tax=Polaromonas sp. TaxID=1869339 RepID=UPI0027377333|nr:carboxymuconolactone decarboxylase family protein [Polaromonas sp.]MDP3799227.1 carboxymuconolactone decarboxylase family protein [Polaromonas sp.]
MLQGVEGGPSLDVQTSELIAFAVRVSVTTLDSVSAQTHAQCALDAGATMEQLHELVLLVSGLGVHTLFEGTRLVNRLAVPVASAQGVSTPPLDEERQRLWDTWIGQDRYWQGFEREVPNFLIELLQASPQGFDAFFRYCAVPWTMGKLPPLTKELVSMAVDATPTHRFLPGMRLHLRNAVKLGAGREAVLEVLEIAAAAPAHPGVA